MLDAAAVPVDADPTEPEGAGVEVQLDPGALAYARIDEQGALQAGNAVFQDICGYDWAEISGAPYSQMRHPDMPRQVFQIMWEGQQDKGSPTVTYVKNKTKDGGFYWALAFASPVEGGYVLVQIKPQSKLFETIAGDYAALRARDGAEGATSDSATGFLTRLQAHGYASCAEFFATAAAQELLYLGQGQGWIEATKIQHLLDVSAALKDVRERCQSIARACDAIELLPTNLEIQSARLGRLAAPIAIIARDSKERTRALRQKMTNFTAEMDRVSASVNTAMVQMCAAQVQGQVRRVLSKDGQRDEGRGAVDLDLEASVLARLGRATEDNQHERFSAAFGQIAACSLSLETILREVTGINVTRTMCSIENSTIDQSGGTIQMIIEELTRFQADIPKALRAIKGLFDVMKRDLDRIVAQ